ncbi:MAG: PIN domain-containing protein [Bacteroidota bacterium]|nr:hypothetical protein [Cytophagales bacterium]
MRGDSFYFRRTNSRSIWQAAANLVADIDPKDTPYVAFSKHFKCKLWSGDNQLIRGLRIS